MRRAVATGRFGAASVVLVAFAAMALAADSPKDTPLRVGPDVSRPKLMKKEEPQYSPEARRSGVEGEVLLSITVGRDGLAHDVYVVSPLGFGLEEEAVLAVSKWRFQPAMKDGKPVDVRANVYVTFSFIGSPYDRKLEHERTMFNEMASRLRMDGPSNDADVNRVRSLVKDKLPAAEYVLGYWEVKGLNLPQDVADGMARIQRAADKYYGPAMFFIGDAKYRGTLLPKDTEGGLRLMRDAAVNGDVSSQYMLGQMYENGVDVPADAERAKRYFRLCAARAIAACELRLGGLLLKLSGDDESKRLEGTAWLELAERHQFEGAAKAAAAARASLTDEQKRSVGTLSQQLERVH